jgi:hypothetical protein
MKTLRDPEEQRYYISADYLAELSEGGDRLPEDGGVYFVECAGFVKIGVGWSVQGRLVSLQVASPLVIVPLGYIHVETGAEALTVETELHQRFSTDRHRGEWFLDTPALRLVIKERAAAWPAPRRRGKRSRKDLRS